MIILLLSPSSGVPDMDCHAGPRETINQITHWLDSSNIYGSSDETANDLRAHKNGLLKSIRLNGFDQCPYDTFENGTIKQCTDAHGK